MSDALVAYLRDRLAEDEAAIGNEDPHGWGYDYCDSTMGVHLTVERSRAEVAAKRAILDIVLGYESAMGYEVGCCHSAEKIGRGECYIKPGQIPGLLALAQPYASRPDFLPEWKVTP